MGSDTEQALRTQACGAVPGHASGHIGDVLKPMLFQETCPETRSMARVTDDGGGTLWIQFLMSLPQIRGGDIDSPVNVACCEFPPGPHIKKYHRLAGCHSLMELYS